MMASSVSFLTPQSQIVLMHLHGGQVGQRLLQSFGVVQCHMTTFLASPPIGKPVTICLSSHTLYTSVR